MRLGRGVAAMAVVAACGCRGEARREGEAQTVRSEMARAETTATRAASIPSTGLWTEEHLVERLVRAGVAPRAVGDAAAGPSWMGDGQALVFHAGGGEVHAWIYRDSTARRAVTDGLDPATAAPAGKVPPFEAPMVFVTQNNLAAVISGGSERNQERIALALLGGLPVTGAPPE